jgi:hypothetical protein
MSMWDITTQHMAGHNDRTLQVIVCSCLQVIGENGFKVQCLLWLR